MRAADAAGMRALSESLAAAEASLRAAASHTPPPMGDDGARAGMNSRGVYWFRYGDGLEAIVVADRVGGRYAVARFMIPDRATRWWVECAAWALLDAIDPPAGRASSPRDVGAGLWEWTRADEDGRRYRLPVLATLMRAGAPVVECSACGAVARAAWGAVRELRARLNAETPDLESLPREWAGCRVKKAVRGLLLLGDHVDGRRRFHARRRAAREALTPTARPALQVLRSASRRAATSVVARRPRPTGDAA